MTIIPSLGESTLNPRSGFTCEEGGKRDGMSPGSSSGENTVLGEGQVV